MLSNPLPKTIDLRELKLHGLDLKGSYALNLFDQLTDLLVGEDGEVLTCLHFGMNEDQQVVLEGRVDANFKMLCQRCLDVTELAVSSDFKLVGVTTDSQIEALPDGYEPMMVQESSIELIPLIEEELLLSLPLVVYHEPDQCRAGQDYTTSVYQASVTGDDRAVAESNKHNPFSVLSSLKI